jgi:hypothetical protein
MILQSLPDPPRRVARTGQIRLLFAEVPAAQGSLRRAWLVATGIVSFAVCGAAPAAADEGKPDSIALHFAVDSSLASQCPDRARFVELLLRERPRLTLAPDGAQARRFDVRIRRGSSRELAGEVVIAELDGAESTRSVTARDCRTLVRALAVVAAVASDVVPEREEPSTVDTPPSAERVTPANAAPAPATSHERPPRPVRDSLPPRLYAGVGTELVLGALPRATMGYRGYVEAQRSLGEVDVGLRVSLAYARAQLSGTSRLNVFVETVTARLEGCAGRRVFAPVSIEACAATTTGAFHSYSAGVAARDDVRPWLTIGTGLRMRWHLGAAFHAELFGSASYVATVYTTIARDQTAEGHQVPRGIGEIGFGLGHSFDLR